MRRCPGTADLSRLPTSEFTFKKTKTAKLAPTVCPVKIGLLLTSSHSIQTIQTSFTIEGLGLVNWFCKEFSAFVGDFME